MPFVNIRIVKGIIAADPPARSGIARGDGGDHGRHRAQ